MNAVITVRKGTSLAKLLSLYTADGEAITPGTYSGSDTLAATIRPAGRFVEGSSALATPSVAWDDATAGEILLTIRASDLTAIPPGEYRLLVNLTKNGESVVRPVLDATLVIQGA